MNKMKNGLKLQAKFMAILVTGAFSRLLTLRIQFTFGKFNPIKWRDGYTATGGQYYISACACYVLCYVLCYIHFYVNKWYSYNRLELDQIDLSWPFSVNYYD